MKRIRTSELGDAYRLKFKIDLVNNRKEALYVNGLALVVMIIMLIPFIRSFYKVGSRVCSGDSLIPILWNTLFCAVGCILYLVAHEAAHGLAMKCFTDAKLRFGYKFVYAYAGSIEGLFKPVEYILIALTPMLFFGVVFELCREKIPYFATSFYLLQMMNVSGSMGDVYVVFRILKHSQEKILINDTGTDMTVYEKV